MSGKVWPAKGEGDKPSTSKNALAAPPQSQTRIPSSADLKKEALHQEIQIVTPKENIRTKYSVSGGPQN